MSALAGVKSPYAYSLRELKWRADALDMRNWNYAAWVCMFQPRFSGGSVAFEKYHPHLRNSAPMTVAEWTEFEKDAKQQLPEALSEEEIDARWREYERQHPAD